MSAAAKTRWRDPDYRARQTASLRRHVLNRMATDPDYRAMLQRNRARANAVWQSMTPDERMLRKYAWLTPAMLDDFRLMQAKRIPLAEIRAILTRQEAQA